MQNFGKDWGFNNQNNQSSIGASILNSYIVQQQKKLADEARKKAEDEAKRKQENDWLSGLLSIGGMVLGNMVAPGIGGIIGGGLGGALGRSSGNYNPNDYISEGIGNSGQYLLKNLKNNDKTINESNSTIYNPWSSIFYRGVS